MTCPLCGMKFTVCNHMAVDLIREIRRLREAEAAQWRDWQFLDLSPAAGDAP